MTALSNQVHAAIAPDGSPARDGITVYGAAWCSDTTQSRAFLDGLSVPYAYVDVDFEPSAEAWISVQNGGERRLPTIVLTPEQPLLFEPTDAELELALAQAGYIESGDERAA